MRVDPLCQRHREELIQVGLCFRRLRQGFERATRRPQIVVECYQKMLGQLIRLSLFGCRRIQLPVAPVFGAQPGLPLRDSPLPSSHHHHKSPRFGDRRFRCQGELEGVVLQGPSPRRSLIPAREVR